MAAAKDTTKLKPEWTAVSSELLTFLRTPFSLNAPGSKPIDLTSIFGGNISHEARELLRQATDQRAKLLEVLADSKSDPRNVISAVDAYLPSIWRVTASMQASAQSLVKLNKKLEFKWTSSLNKKGKEFTGTVFLYETAFVLTIRALYHRDAAKIIQEQSPEAYQEMGKELRMAAGIFDFVANDLLARWHSPPEHRAPEVLPLVHHCLAALFLADAQRLAIAKALETGSNATLIAKLLIGAADKYEFATRNMQGVDKETFDSMVPGLLEELGAFPAILRGCASNCLAQSAWARGEYGKGLGYANDGARRLQSIAMGKALQNSALQAALTKAIGRALDLEEECQNDCNNVYFEKINKDIRMVDGTFIINAIPYELPSADLVSFGEMALPPSQTKMPIQNFWSALWAKPQDYPANNEEQHTAAKAVSGATDLPGVTEAFSNTSISSSAPQGVDPSVFSSLPPEIQQEILEDASRKEKVQL